MISRYEARELKALRCIWGIYYLLLHERETKCVSDDPVPTIWYSLLGQRVFSESLRCRSVLHNCTCIDSRDFPTETDNTFRKPQNIYFIKARDVKNENQLINNFLLNPYELNFVYFEIRSVQNDITSLAFLHEWRNIIGSLKIRAHIFVPAKKAARPPKKQ